MFSTQDVRDIFAAVETETDEEDLPFVLAAMSHTLSITKVLPR
jgi:hypothetical protein